MQDSRRRLIPANQWNEHHEWPPIGGMRHLIFNAESNGFNTAIRRVGRRVLIDEAAFFAWVESSSMTRTGPTFTQTTAANRRGKA